MFIMLTPKLDTDVPVPDRITAGIERTQRNVATTGTSWTGAQRVAFATAARAASSGETLGGGGPVSAAVRDLAAKVATEPHAMTASDAHGFDEPAAYVEIVGVVARTVAMDTVVRGVGASLLPLPAGTSERPNGDIARNAPRRAAWVPMVGGAGPATALSAAPAEDAAQADLHGALYLTYDEMADLTIHKGLPRWQLELVAARTSLINQCMF